MKVANKNAVNLGRGGLCENKLPLRSLSWVKEEPLLVPPQKVRPMIPQSSRLLGRTAQNNQISYTQNLALDKEEIRPKIAPNIAPEIWAVLAMLKPPSPF